MKIVSFASYAPYRGVPHAGGEYYLRHVRALIRAGHDVTVVAPLTPENALAVERPPDGATLLLVRERRSVRTRLGDRVVELLRHAVPPTRFTDAVLADPRVIAAIRQADLFEYQWVQTAALARRVQTVRGRRRIPAVCVAHDVLSQALRRQAQQIGLPPSKRILRVVRARVGAREERHNLRQVDLVLTFSDKDRALLRALGVRAEAIAPPLADEIDPLPREPEAPPVVLFVGAFDRLENYDAAHWLLESIWPAVLRSRPDARLELVGAHPSTTMTSAAAPPQIVVTGYVADLDPWYRRASVALVPLRLGAGVKFKVVAAMLQEVPVVTTAVGAEGIGSVEDGLFATVTDDAAELAAGVVRVLDEPARVIAERARVFAQQRYGQEGFQVRLDWLYRSLITAVEPSAPISAEPGG